MTTHAIPDLRAAFLRDICAHPDDDMPRLIFADWLEEQGDLARAEFIRVQCRIAEINRELKSEEDCGGLCCEERRLLRHCELDLLRNGRLGNPFGKDSGIIWTLEPRPTSSECVCHGVVFRRGFVAEIALTHAAFNAHALTLAGLPLERVTLTGVEPWQYRDQYGWWRAAPVDFCDRGYTLLPDLWDCLTAGEVQRNSQWRWYAPKANAHADLSAACCRWLARLQG